MTVFDNIKVTPSLAVAAARTADANGTAVDTKGYTNGMLVVDGTDIDLANADETYAVKVQESDDGSTGWTDVSGATTSITADGQVKEIRLAELNVTTKRYLRAVLDVGGTTPSFLGAAYFVLGGKASGPVDNA